MGYLAAEKTTNVVRQVIDNYVVDNGLLEGFGRDH